MSALSQRLQPSREAFAERLYQSSLSILEKQVCDNSSLFWRVPSRVVENLRRLLDDEAIDRLGFFLVSHALCHREVPERRDQPILSGESVIALMKRCVDPQGPDIRRGLLALSTPIPRLNRRRLHSAVARSLAPSFEERTDLSDSTEWQFETRREPWWLICRIALSATHFQLDPTFDVLLGMGDLYLARQLSLHRMYGIGPGAWDLVRSAEEEDAAKSLAEYCGFMLSFLSGILVDLRPGISKEEVVRAEKEWKQWLAEVRTRRGKRPLQS